jgi:hypothetical protein
MAILVVVAAPAAIINLLTMFSFSEPQESKFAIGVVAQFDNGEVGTKEYAHNYASLLQRAASPIRWCLPLDCESPESGGPWVVVVGLASAGDSTSAVRRWDIGAVRTVVPVHSVASATSIVSG